MSSNNAPSSCWQHNWPRVFLVVSLLVTIFAFVGIILEFAKMFFSPNIFLLNIYCLVFSFLGLSAELRQFSPLRRVVYIWLRVIYFLVYYRARGIFYVLFGFLLLGTGPVEVLAGSLSIALGVLMIIVSLAVNLPRFEDPEEEKRVREEYQSYYGLGSVSAAAPEPSFSVANAGVQNYPPASPASTGNNPPVAVAEEALAPPAAYVAPPSRAANPYREYNSGETGAREERGDEEEAFSRPSTCASPYESKFVFHCKGVPQP